MQLEYLARGMGKYQWREYPAELMGKRLGIIGLGALGQAIARLALAYKMEVRYYSRTRKQIWEDRGVQYLDKAVLVETSEVILISTPSNLKALNAKDFLTLQPGSILVQASSGNCFDKQAFMDWIVHNNNHAIFDYSAGSENYEAYKDLPRVIFPKVFAGYTFETRQRLGNKVLDDLKNYLAAQ